MVGTGILSWWNFWVNPWFGKDFPVKITRGPDYLTILTKLIHRLRWVELGGKGKRYWNWGPRELKLLIATWWSFKDQRQNQAIGYIGWWPFKRRTRWLITPKGRDWFLTRNFNTAQWFGFPMGNSFLRF